MGRGGINFNTATNDRRIKNDNNPSEQHNKGKIRSERDENKTGVE